MIDEFPVKIKISQALTSPSTDMLCNMDGSKPLKKNKAELLYTTMDRGLFLCKIARTDIQTNIYFLCTRAKHPNQKY